MELEKYDMFCNLTKAANIKCPVFLIHGGNDEVLPQDHSLQMMKKIKFVYEWFPPRGTHNNILTKYRGKFYSKIKLFFEHLKYNNPQTSASDIEQSRISLKKGIKCEENYLLTEKENRACTSKIVPNQI